MYQVEKEVPIPKARQNSVYPFAEMNVGDSFFIANVDKLKAASIRACASTFGKKKGMKFSCRHVEGGVRVWRTA